MHGLRIGGSWKDWSTVALGFWLAVSPWLLGVQPPGYSVVWHVCIPVGILLVAGGVGAVARPSGWTERLMVLSAVWLLIAPGTWSDRIPAVSWDNIAIGFAVLTLAFWRLRDLVRANVAR